MLVESKWLGDAAHLPIEILLLLLLEEEEELELGWECMLLLLLGVVPVEAYSEMADRGKLRRSPPPGSDAMLRCCNGAGGVERGRGPGDCASTRACNCLAIP